MSKKTIKVAARKESWDQKLLRKLFKKAQKAEKAGKE